MTLGLTLLVFYLYGYTLNRITLFALIFSIGILVDDAIVVVENIVRHMGLPGCRRKRLVQIAVEAVDEVGNPTDPCDLGGHRRRPPDGVRQRPHGPLHAPDPRRFERRDVVLAPRRVRSDPVGGLEGASRPFLTRLVPHPIRGRTADRGGGEAADGAMPDTFLARLYQRVMRPLFGRSVSRWAFLSLVAAATLGAMALVGLGIVKVKMLPFDNKSEFQVIINMPEGSTLDQTARAAREMAASIRGEPEVRDYQVYVGTASPFNFNGLVRHYFMRRGSTVADLQVNLLPKAERRAQSHDIARRIRPGLAASPGNTGPP